MMNKGTGRQRKIAVFNHDKELLSLITQVIKDKGALVIEGLTEEYQSGEEDIQQVLTDEDPDTVVWDIPYPYKENWDYFKKMKDSEYARGRRFILTTTGDLALSSIAGEELKGFEIIPKPFEDIEKMADTIMTDPEEKESKKEFDNPSISGERET